MNAPNDHDRQLTDFLRGGPEELPYGSLDAIRDSIEETGQRVVISSWRPSDMNKIVTFSLGAAAVVVATVIGIQVVDTPKGGLDVESSQTPAQTITREPTASVAAGIPEGRYLLSEGTDGGVSITVTIDSPLWSADECWSDPGGRIGEDPRLLVALQGPGAACAGAPDGAGLISFQSREYRVYGDACHYDPPPPPHPNMVATTVGELADALARQVHRRLSTSIEDITVDGYPGKKVILQLAGDVIFHGNDCEDDEYVLFGLPEDRLARYSQGPQQMEELWIVDVGGLTVVLGGLYYPDTPQSVVDELRAILASATFGLP